MATKRKSRGEAAQRPARREMPWGELPSPQRPGELPRGKRADNPISGLVVVDKDKGVTSHDVVGAVRRLAGTRKVGHAGTLDPMATGVLCVGVGAATRLLRYVIGTSKEYAATIRFGIATATEDAEGEILYAPGAVADLPFGDGPFSGDSSRLGPVPNREESQEKGQVGGPATIGGEALAGAMQELAGDIMQVPSTVSALKVDGKRAYELAREGKDVELAARPVAIHAFEALGNPRQAWLELPEEGEPASACRETEAARGTTGKGLPCVDLDVRVECSAGTYIRALARDLGEKLGTAAHLTALRRTRVGPWKESEALSVAALAEFARRGEPLPLVPLANLCRGLFPALDITEPEAQALRHGRFLSSANSRLPALWQCETPGAARAVAMLGPHPVALVEPHPRHADMLKPALVFANADS